MPSISWEHLRQTPDFTDTADYQSLPSTSPPAGVKAAAQVKGEVPAASVLTLPSPRPTCIEMWDVEANRRSHCPPPAAVDTGLRGWTWNFEAAPCSQATPSRPRPPPKTAERRSPGKLS